MNASIADQPPGWFRIVSIAALIWGLIGIATYLMHVGIIGGGTAALSEPERILAESTPSWVTAAYAIAVFSGALGSLGLVLRKRWAKLVLIVSLVAILIQEAWVIFMSDAAAVHGPSALLLPLVIVVVAVLLVWVASMAEKRGWLT